MLKSDRLLQPALATDDGRRDNEAPRLEHERSADWRNR